MLGNVSVYGVEGVLAVQRRILINSILRVCESQPHRNLLENHKRCLTVIEVNGVGLVGSGIGQIVGTAVKNLLNALSVIVVENAHVIGQVVDAVNPTDIVRRGRSCATRPNLCLDIGRFPIKIIHKFLQVKLMRLTHKEFL